MQERAQESEKYMAGLVAEMEKVRLEKLRLEERNQLLEKVLALSQKQHAPPPTKGLLELVCFLSVEKSVSSPLGIIKLRYLSPAEVQAEQQAKHWLPLLMFSLQKQTTSILRYRNGRSSV